MDRIHNLMPDDVWKKRILMERAGSKGIRGRPRKGWSDKVKCWKKKALDRRS